MSVSLDLALFLRDNNKILKLSTSDIGVAFVFAFRIGSNAYSWISQDELSEELGISASNVRIHTRKLEQKGFIIIKKDPSDNRKNLYSFTDNFQNYWQMKDAERQKCSDRYHLKIGAISKSTAQKQAVYTAQKQAVLICTNDPASPSNPNEKEMVTSPKGKEQINIQDKQTFICTENMDIPSQEKVKKKKKKTIVPDNLIYTESQIAFATAKNLDIDHEKREFIEFFKLKGEKKISWRGAFCTWLRNSYKWGMNSKSSKTSSYQQKAPLADVSNQSTSFRKSTPIDRKPCPDHLRNW